jgi:hypothetical protein
VNQRIVVTLAFSLNRNGTLAGPVSVKPTGSGLLFEAAAESAVRAVRKCTAPPVGPMRLPADAYEYWREIEASFDPTERADGAALRANSSHDQPRPAALATCGSGSLARFPG